MDSLDKDSVSCEDSIVVFDVVSESEGEMVGEGSLELDSTTEDCRPNREANNWAVRDGLVRYALFSVQSNVQCPVFKHF